MSYTHWQMAVPLKTSGGDTVMAATATTADVGYWLAGPMQVVVRGFAVQHTTTGAWAAAAVSFRKTCGKYASTSGNQIAKITMGTSGLREDGFYYNTSFTPTKIPGGYGIAAIVTDVAASGLFRAWAIVEPSWERFDNFSTGTTDYHVGVTG